MWIITDKGFISAVEYRPSMDHISKETGLPEQLPASLGPLPPTASRNERRRHARLVKHGFILARARLAEDLEQLRPYYPALEVVAMKSADYKFRCVLPRVAYANWAYDKSLGIDYVSHFKEVVRDRAPKGKDRYGGMMRIWSVLNELGEKPKPTTWAKYSSGKAAPGFTSAAKPVSGYGYERSDYQPKLPISHGVEGHGMTVAQLVEKLQAVSLDDIELPKETSDITFFVWEQAAGLFEGQDSPLDAAQIVELLEEALANAMTHEINIIETALEAARDKAVDEDAESSTG